MEKNASAPPRVFLFPTTSLGYTEKNRGDQVQFNLGIMKLSEGLKLEAVDPVYPKFFHEKAELYEVFGQNNWDIVGFSTYLPSVMTLEEGINEIKSMCDLSNEFKKKNTRGLVILGGHASHHYTEMFLMNSPAHIVVVGVYGEAIETMREIVREYDISWVKNGEITDMGHNTLSKISGIAYKYRGKMYSTKIRMPPEKMPVLNWDIENGNVPLMGIQKDGDIEVYLNIQILRAGCAFSLSNPCRYCTMGAELAILKEQFGEEVVKRLTNVKNSLDVAIQEIKNLKEKLDDIQTANHGYRFGRIILRLSDDDTSYRTLTSLIGRLKSEAGLSANEMDIRFLIRPETLTPEYIGYLESQIEDGINFMAKIGVEFGSKRDLEFVNRHYNVNEVLEKIKKLRKIGVKVGTFHILTTPTSTCTDFKENLAVFMDLWGEGLDEYTYGPVLYKWGKTFPELESQMISFVVNGKKWEFRGALRPIITDKELQELMKEVKHSSAGGKEVMNELLVILKKEVVLRKEGHKPVCGDKTRI